MGKTADKPAVKIECLGTDTIWTYEFPFDDVAYVAVTPMLLVVVETNGALHLYSFTTLHKAFISPNVTVKRDWSLDSDVEQLAGAAADIVGLRLHGEMKRTVSRQS